MKGLNGVPLDDDILDMILMFSPDFSTLKSMILTAKAFYNVYKLHPHSILRAVAYNVVGQALPQALRTIRYRIRDADGSGEDSEDDDQLSYDPEGAETGEYAPIVPQETSELVRNAGVVKGLEDLFSLRHKDRRSTDSKLTFTESLRFQRAMYRIMLYSRIFNGSQYEDEELDDEDEDMADQLAKVRRERKNFLDSFTNEHLLEIDIVARFLVETAVQVIFRGTVPVENATNVGDRVLSVGPEAIYESHEEDSDEPLTTYFIDVDWVPDDSGDGPTNPLVEGYISYPLGKLYEVHDIKPPPQDSTPWKLILDVVVGESDTCSRCAAANEKGFDLWGPSTYEYLAKSRQDFGSHRIIIHLKGHLRYNKVEKHYFDTLMSKRAPQQTVYDYIVLDILQGDYRESPFDDWKKEDWLCSSCLKKLLDENLHLWLLKKRAEAGDHVPSSDCWWGWNCRTQTHKDSHAVKLNHICPQTKTG